MDKTVESLLGCMCNEKGETVQLIVSEHKKLAQHEYKRQHDNVAKFVHWKLCEKLHLVWRDKWYEHAPEGSVENDNASDMNIQCDNIIKARRPDIVLVEKKEKKGSIIDIEKIEKVEKYQDLKREIGGIWQMRSVNVVPVVIGALSSVTKKFEKWLEKVQVDANIGVVKKNFLVGNNHVLRKVSEL